MHFSKRVKNIILTINLMRTQNFILAHEIKKKIVNKSACNPFLDIQKMNGKLAIEFLLSWKNL